MAMEDILKKALTRDDLVGIAEASPDGAIDALGSLEETEELIRHAAEQQCEDSAAK